MRRSIKLLMIEDNASDAKMLTRMLQRSAITTFDIEHVEWLNTALTLLQNTTFDIALLDLSLPDPGAQGIDTLVQFIGSAGGVPVIVMTGYDDITTAVNCVKYGAQDYLIKDEVRTAMLERSIIYAIERRHAEIVSKNLMRASLKTLGSTSGEDVALVLIREHLNKLPGLIEEIRSYVGKNAPAHIDALNAIFDNYDIEVLLREARELVGKERRGLRPTMSYNDVARDTVRKKTVSSLPPPKVDAKSQVLDALTRLRSNDE